LQRPGPVMMPHEGSGAALRGFVALISARARHTIVRVAEKAAYTPPTLSGERREIPNGEDLLCRLQSALLKLARGTFRGGIRDWPSLNEQNLMGTQVGPNGINSQSHTTSVRNVKRFDSYLPSFGYWLNGNISALVVIPLTRTCFFT
jgi:hypothetical protein